MFDQFEIVFKNFGGDSARQRTVRVIEFSDATESLENIFPGRRNGATHWRNNTASRNNNATTIFCIRCNGIVRPECMTHTAIVTMQKIRIFHKHFVPSKYTVRSTQNENCDRIQVFKFRFLFSDSKTLPLPVTLRFSSSLYRRAMLIAAHVCVFSYLFISFAATVTRLET